MLIVRNHNYQVSNREDAEVVLAIDVLEPHEYALTPLEALKLAAALEEQAKVIIAAQRKALDEYEWKKGAPGKER